MVNNCNNIQKENKAVILSFDDENLEKIPDSDDPYLDIRQHYDFFEMIDSLDIEGKELLSLKYSNHYDNKAIAKILNIKEGTLRMRLLRIRNKLKMKYKGDKENE